MQRNTTTRLVVAMAAVGLTLAACGSDDKAADTTKAPATTAATPASAAGNASQAYCDAAMAINTAGTAAGDPDADPVAFAKQLIGPAKTAAAVAPTEIADEYTTAINAMQAAIDGDSSKLAELDAAAPKIDDFNATSCPWTKVPVTLEDFHFVGLPESLKAGDYTFALNNTGADFHLLVIVKKKAGVTESFDELLADPAGESKVETVIGGGADPGEQANAFGHLEPGEYLALCPIPQGSAGTTEGTGPPHFTLGMSQALTVT